MPGRRGSTARPRHPARVVASALVALSCVPSWIAGCTTPPRDAEAGTTPVERAVRQALADIDSGDVARVYALICPEERKGEALTLPTFKRLVGKFRVATAGAQKGEVLLSGDSDLLEGRVIYKAHGHPLTMLGVTCRSHSGKSVCAYVTFEVVAALAVADGAQGDSALVSHLAYQRALLNGWRDLKPELEAIGLRTLWETNPDGPCYTLDEEISRMEARIKRTQARDAQRVKAAGP